ncbi:MAG: O-methyltransferase [Sinomicrobium sp.]|nr:O-methyltransferase [Sinomicrobium sp.]
MDLLPENIERYIREHSEEEPAVLRELSRETHLKVLNPRMMSGHFQGRLLSMLSKLIRPRTILEIGTYTGYSAICLAEGLPEGGTLHTIDRNEELFRMQRRYFVKSGFGEKIVQHTGNALEIIPELDLRFDLVFIDADKSNYGNYFDLVITKMNPGGLIIADNVLWSGKVLDEGYNDKDTAALKAYNKKVKEDKRVEPLLLPVRDGLSLSRVKPVA